jgi:hypothetical protein
MLLLALLLVFISYVTSEIHNGAELSDTSLKMERSTVQLMFTNDFSEKDSPYCELCLIKSTSPTSSCIQLEPGDELVRRSVPITDRFIVRCPSTAESHQRLTEYFGVVDCSTLSDKQRIFLKDSANTKTVILPEEHNLDVDEVLKILHPKVDANL